MEKKNNHTIIIILMGVIIVILAVLCILFATNIITLNNNFNTKNEPTTDKKENIPEKDYILNQSEATAIIENIFKNKTVRSIIDNPPLTFCTSADDKMYSEKELGLDYEWNGYYKCSEFNSYEELTNHFKTYFTTGYYKTNIENKGTISTKTYKMPNGTVIYNYYEKDGALYYACTGKGGNMSKNRLFDVNSNITNITATEIDATINAVWLAVDETVKSEENITMKLEKENNQWKISSYDVK